MKTRLMVDVLLLAAALPWLMATVVPTAQAQSVQYAFTNLAGLPGPAGSADGVGQAAGFNYPKDIAVDNAGNLFVADGNTIRKVTLAGVVTTLAGRSGQVGRDDGAGSAARFAYPAGIALDDAGNLYVTDSGTIRKVTPAGVVTTLAGQPEQFAWTGADRSSDGKGSAARFTIPWGIAADGPGTVYVADDVKIRKITPDGMVTTLAGSWPGGYADGTGSQAKFSQIFSGGIAVDRGGMIYVADPNNRVIRKVTPSGVVTTLAGSAGQVGRDDGVGNSARFRYPTALEVDGTGNLLVIDEMKIRLVTPEGIVTTLPWNLQNFGWGFKIAADDGGNLYLGDTYNCGIQKLMPDGTMTLLAGHGNHEGSADGSGTDARFNTPSAIAVDDAGNLYVADSGNNTIRKVTPAGVVTTLAGQPNRPPGDSCSDCYVDGVGSQARFWIGISGLAFTSGIAVDSTGQVYVGDAFNGAIRKITPEGIVSTLARRVGGGAGIALGNAGVLYAADGERVSKVTPDGVVTTFYGGPGHSISAITADRSGNVFVGDNLTIKKVSASGEVTTLAGASITVTNQIGQAVSFVDHVDGIGSAARFSSLKSMCVDGQGNIFAADSSGWPATIRKITPEGQVMTVAGAPDLSVGHADGIGPAAQFGSSYLMGIAIDRAGHLYVADGGNNRISKGIPILVPDPRFSSVAVNDGAVTAQLSGLVAGRRIIIESSTNLRDWSSIQTNVASGASQTISHPINPASQAEFLRATMK